MARWFRKHSGQALGINFSTDFGRLRAEERAILGMLKKDMDIDFGEGLVSKLPLDAEAGGNAYHYRGTLPSGETIAIVATTPQDLTQFYQRLCEYLNIRITDQELEAKKNLFNRMF